METGEEYIPTPEDVDLTCEKVVEGVHLRCARVVGGHLWGGERDGTVTVRDVYTAAVVERIPLFNTQTPDGHHADEFAWSILPVELHVWVGYSSGIIRVFDLVHFRRHVDKRKEWDLDVKKQPFPFKVVQALQEHKGGVYSMTTHRHQFSRETNFVFSCSNDFTVRAWDPKTFAHIQVGRHSVLTCRCVIEMADPPTLLLNGVCMVEWLMMMQMYDGHNNYVRSLCVFGPYMCSASEDHTLREIFS